MNRILSMSTRVLVLAAMCLLGAMPAQSQPAAQIAAAKTDDQAALVAIFGAKYRDRIGTVDKARDRELRARFARMAEEYGLLHPEPDGSVTLVVGYEAWSFPIPLVKEGSGW